MLTINGYTSLGGHYFDGFPSNLVHTFPPSIAKMSLSIGQKNPSILVTYLHTLWVFTLTLWILRTKTVTYSCL